MKSLYPAALLLVFLWSQPLCAARTAEPFEALFPMVTAEFGLPEGLLTAIAKVESGFNPWALNIGGRAYQCLSKEEALARAKAARAAGRSFDLGLMQINSWWLDKFSLSLEAILEPRTNIRLGAWILKEELERHGDLRRAVGAYHSPRPHRAGPYADLVLAAWGKKAPPSPAVSTIHFIQHSREIKVSGTLSANSMKVRRKTYD
ncbi:MAG: lytic transglycosylase domain-containing protein [Deltaproteobacteria bacterium]|nr:lytic transglycosylase domain-containing protein [Deltaproteobacteria bacterium]